MSNKFAILNFNLKQLLLAAMLVLSPMVVLCESDPTPPEKLYQEMYTSSPIRVIRFSNELDPLETIREEVFLESYLCKIAEKFPVAKNESLLADIDFYQTKQLLDDWINYCITPTMPSQEIYEELYREKIQDFTQPETITFQHIFLLIPENNTEVEDSKQQLATKIVKQLRRGREFGQLAKEYSDLPIAEKNAGVVGPIPTNKINQALQDALKNQKVNSILDPIRTPYGLEIIQILERQEERTLPLEVVKDQLSSEIFQKDLSDQRSKLIQKVQASFPANINEDKLSEGSEYKDNVTIVTIDGISYTMKEVLLSVSATYAHSDIKDKMERLKKGLDRFILTKQIVADAKKRGLFEVPDIKERQQLIHNRLLAERYFVKYTSPVNPTEEQLKSYYQKNIEKFRKPNKNKGQLLTWKIESIDELSKGELNFQRTTVSAQIKEYINQYENKEITLDQIKELAGSTKVLDWFEEGPMGYQIDMAFSRTDKEALSSPFRSSEGLSIVFVEDKLAGETITFADCMDKVEKLYLLKIKEQEKEALVNEALKAYAESQSDL